MKIFLNFVCECVFQWVQCDKCKAWQHQICALFNGKRKEALQAEYICPKCYLEELERGKREPLPQSSILGASDLPKTILSDHIEQWIFQRLKQEREERARILKRSVDEVMHLIFSEIYPCSLSYMKIIHVM